jgi:hypothetical protein
MQNYEAFSLDSWYSNLGLKYGSFEYEVRLLNNRPRRSASD